VSTNRIPSNVLDRRHVRGHRSRRGRGVRATGLRYAVSRSARKAGLKENCQTHWPEIVERFVDDVVILDVHGGPIAFADSSDQLLNAIRQLVNRGSHKILLNLRDVHYIDSDGLTEIVEGFKTSRNADGTLKLCEVVPGFRRLLAVTKLDRVIEVFESEDAALRSFAAEA
jgi:anti-sigma B factor antagonist